VVARRRPRLRWAPKRPIALAIPAPLSGRVDALVAVADAADEPAARNEVIAALIYAAPDSPEELARLLKDYRTARVSDAFVPGYNQRIFLNPLRRQGPRRSLQIEEGEPATPGIDPGDVLQYAPAVRLGPTIPEPLHVQLEVLVKLAESAGERTTRKELVAALILAAATSLEDVADVLRQYRRAPAPETGSIFRRKRGRPRRGL
jgi:hypothetical protein